MRKPATLSVQVLGPFAVARDGVTVPAHELASRKGRMLLKLLVARRGAVVPAAVVAEALWGDRPPADPDANLATLVSRLRSVLGADAIAGDRHGWRFAGRYPRIVVDLDEAERLTAEAEARLDDEPALAGAAAGRARPPRARAGHGRRTGRRLGRDVRLGQVPGARPSTGRSAKYRALGQVPGARPSTGRSAWPGSAATRRRCGPPPRSPPTTCSPRSPPGRPPAPPSTASPPRFRGRSAPRSWSAAGWRARPLGPDATSPQLGGRPPTPGAQPFDHLAGPLGLGDVEQRAVVPADPVEVGATVAQILGGLALPTVAGLPEGGGDLVGSGRVGAREAFLDPVQEAERRRLPERRPGPPLQEPASRPPLSEPDRVGQGRAAAQHRAGG